MKSYGVETVAMDVDWARTGNKVTVYGSEKGVNFVDELPDLEWNFATYTCGRIFLHVWFLT